MCQQFLTLLGCPLRPDWKVAGIRPARGPGQQEEGPCRRSWPAALEPCTGLHPPPAERSPPDPALPPAEGAWGHMGDTTLLSSYINCLQQVTINKWPGLGPPKRLFILEPQTKWNLTIITDGYWKVNMKTKLLVFNFFIQFSGLIVKCFISAMTHQNLSLKCFSTPDPFHQQQKLFIHFKLFPINALEGYFVNALLILKNRFI